MVDQPGLMAHLIDELIVSVRDIRLTQLMSFATATIVVYDYLVCIEREVELIWKKRWSVIKLAFLWRNAEPNSARLSADGLSSSLRVRSCSFWFYWETWGYCGVLFTSEAVLLLWIYVVYNKNKWILALMGICYIGEVASVVSILTISFSGFEASAFHAKPDINYCVLSNIGRPFPLLWVPILAYDSLLLLLFLYRGCAGASPNSSSRWGYKYDGLLDMIYRHSLLNFLAIFASYLACATIWLTSTFGLYQAPVGFALALSITNCTRLLLNIRRAYYSGVGDPILFNIRDIPPTGTNTPVALDLPLQIPMSPLSASSAVSAFTQCSETTLREPTISSTSTLAAPRASPIPSSPLRAPTHRYGYGYERDPPHPHHPHHVYRRHLAPAPPSITIPPPVSASASAATSTETLRPRNASEYSRGSWRVYVSQEDRDSDWWHVELRDMHGEPGPDVSFGEAV
ncbi:hypothetical protein GSI_03745 [Ganoderma sinense ZZ0214-1]|uniref:DUF6533 domain-containing protein n=1 Tax=Ganoderma sinense ZZ0214-1 TaxID=1077348 RepID=A0A2G8SJU5_9APHY|nr:hypothetical protein GSI_03745 [Ganoderma sinense ZZ0214-1]